MKPKQFFFVLVGLMAVIVGIGGFGYYLAVTYVHRTTVALESAYTASNGVQSQLDYIAHLQNVYRDQVGPALPKINAALPQAKGQTEILAQLEYLAHGAGLALSNVTFPGSAGPSATSQAVAAGTVLALPVSFQTTGSYAQLQSFLSGIENLNRLTSVTDLSVAKGDKGQVSFTITLNAFFKP